MNYTPEERYIIWLSAVDGIGVQRFRKLMDLFGSAQNVWDNVDAPELRFLGKTARDALKAARCDAFMETLFENLEKSGCVAIPHTFSEYPYLLSEIYDPPAVLYMRGHCALYEDRMFSIVGSRRCTRDGVRAATEISEALAHENVTVVSGMARGIDTAAHEGALRGKGRTIAVFGCGPDVIYPPENSALAERILEYGGSIVSEYPPGVAPLQGHFPARNRIISGLTQGTLLVEGAKGSGAMITVHDAIDQNRDVFAVPGSIYSALSAMPNRLIVDGCVPVLSAWEILEFYHWAERPSEMPAKRSEVKLSDEEKVVVLPLTEQPLSFEELKTQTNIPVSRLNSLLTMLELRGIIMKIPGGMYRAYLDAPLQ